MSTRWATLDGTPTRVIAHRGASGLLPEHTIAAYALALQQGADVIEPDLLITRDGELVARHDAGLARSTDVASQTDFSLRQRDGDWPLHEFTSAELAELRAVQPFAQRDRQYDGRFPIPTFAEVLAWADASARLRGTPVTLYPELKHPSWLIERGLDPVAAFIRAVADVDAADVVLLVQCFEIDALRRVRDATGLPVHLLLDERTDWRGALALHASELDGIAVSKRLLDDAALVEESHARGLAVHAWTYRDDVLPDGVACVEDEISRAFELGVDAEFCDFQGTAVSVRGRV